MSCPHRAVHATSGCWYQLRVPLVEGSEFHYAWRDEERCSFDCA